MASKFFQQKNSRLILAESRLNPLREILDPNSAPDLAKLGDTDNGRRADRLRLEDGRDLGGRPGGPPKQGNAHPPDPPPESSGEGIGRVGHELEQTINPGNHGRLNG